MTYRVKITPTALEDAEEFYLWRTRRMMICKKAPPKIGSAF